jgi:DNA-binding IclR family transcriptional regulator
VIQKVLDILRLFEDGKDHISIEGISEALDLPKSTVYRYVRILCDQGFLEKSAGPNYRLGINFFKLSRAALNSDRDIRLMALPSMKRLAEEVGESVSLMRIINRQVVCIESIEGQHALRVSIERGRTQPLHAGASSKVLLAYVAEERWPAYLDLPLKRFTSTTLTDFDALREHLRLVRRRGYSVSDGEIDVGARAVAVPLHNNRDEVVAALSIEAPQTRMDDVVLQRYIELLQAEAAVIREIMG